MLKDQNTYFNNQQMFRREKKSLLYSIDVRSFNHLKRFIIGLYKVCLPNLGLKWMHLEYLY